MLLTVLLVSLCAMGSTAAKKVYRRQIVKEFSVGARPELALSNRFGEIRIVEGADRKITVRVELRGEGKTDEEARRYAEAVNVDLSLSGNRVEGRTTFQKIICNNCGRAADFTVTVPRDVVLSLANQFGNIYINRATQPLTVTVKYGDLYLKEASTASVNVSFGKASIDRCAMLNLNSPRYRGATHGQDEVRRHLPHRIRRPLHIDRGLYADKDRSAERIVRRGQIALQRPQDRRGGAWLQRDLRQSLLQRGAPRPDTRSRFPRRPLGLLRPNPYRRPEYPCRRYAERTHQSAFRHGWRVG